MGDFAEKLFYLLHILAVIVGFGSSFVWPLLSARARKMDTPSAYAINKTGLEASKVLTTPFIWAAGAFGVVLIILEEGIEFSDTWISIAFLLFFVAVLFAAFVHVPNLRVMVGLQEKLAAGEVTPGQGGPPAEVVELGERGKRAGIYGGVLHLLFLLLMIDMIWQPGR